MDKLADITLLQAFVAVADVQSFAEGARKLGLTRSAAGKAVARLESMMEVRLLHRTTRSVSLTSEGQVFYRRVSQILSDLEDAQAEVQFRDARPRGVLRITAPEAFGRNVILPILTSFLKQWPDVRAEASFTDDIVDIVEEGFDMAIRFGMPTASSDLIVRTIARSVAVLCASPEYLAQFGRPSSIEELLMHRQLLSGSRDNPRGWVLHINRESEFAVPAKPFLLCDNAGALRDAALAGLGIACLPEFLVDHDIKSSALESVLGLTTAEFPVCIVYPTKRHLSPKVRLFIDLMVEKLRECT